MDEFTHVQEAKSKTGRFVLIVALIAVVVFIALLGWGNDGELSMAEVLDRVPALALTQEELALAETILDYDDFRNSLNYDLVENATVFSVEETWDVYRSVIPENAEVTEVTVAGAVVTIGYTQPQHRIYLEYLDADRSGTVDSIRKTLAPIIDGVSTGCYQVNYNLSTGKIVYTYRSN